MNYLALIYFVTFTVIGIWFFLNMLIGVLFTSFQSARRSKEKNQNLDLDRARWVKIQKKILYERPYNIAIPKKGFRSFIHNVTESFLFKSIINTSYFTNLVIVIFNFNNDFKKHSLIYQLNFILCIIYILELLSKIIVFGIAPFFRYFFFFFNFHNFNWIFI